MDGFVTFGSPFAMTDFSTSQVVTRYTRTVGQLWAVEVAECVTVG